MFKCTKITLSVMWRGVAQTPHHHFLPLHTPNDITFSLSSPTHLYHHTLTPFPSHTPHHHTLTV